MDITNLLIVIVPVAVLIGVVYYLINSKMEKLKEDLKPQPDPTLMEWLKDMKVSTDKTREELQKQLNEQRNSMDNQMKTQNELLNQRLGNQSQIMSDQTKLITDRLQGAQETIRNIQGQLGGIQEFGKDIKDLSNVLKSPKMRGGLGEQFLYDILGSSLPNDKFKTQYRFKDGNICDAVIFTERGIIPVDSKFPLENFQVFINASTDDARDRAKKAFESDVKKRIDEISKKYILPEEGTTEQAVMYVPSENVYYELLVNSPQVEDYAKQRNVIMASPNTISYFLKVLLVAYQQQELAKHANEILKALGGIKIEAEKYSEEMSVLEKHISNAYKAAEGLRSRFTKLFTKIENVAQIEQKEGPSLLSDNHD